MINLRPSEVDSLNLFALWITSAAFGGATGFTAPLPFVFLLVCWIVSRITYNV